MRVNRQDRSPSDSAALADGDFVQIVLLNSTHFFARVIEDTDVYLRVVMHSVQKPSHLIPLGDQKVGDCKAIDALIPWSAIGIVMHHPGPHDCACLEA